MSFEYLYELNSSILSYSLLIVKDISVEQIELLSLLFPMKELSLDLNCSSFKLSSFSFS